MPLLSSAEFTCRKFFSSRATSHFPEGTVISTVSQEEADCWAEKLEQETYPDSKKEDST